MALPDNPTCKQLQDYCDDAIQNRVNEGSGFDLTEWRRMNSALYKDQSLLSRVRYMIELHPENFLYITAVLESIRLLHASDFEMIIPEIPVLTNEQILEEVASQI